MAFESWQNKENEQKMLPAKERDQHNEEEQRIRTKREAGREVEWAEQLPGARNRAILWQHMLAVTWVFPSGS